MGIEGREVSLPERVEMADGTPRSGLDRRLGVGSSYLGLEKRTAIGRFAGMGTKRRWSGFRGWFCMCERSRGGGSGASSPLFSGQRESKTREGKEERRRERKKKGGWARAEWVWAFNRLKSDGLD